MTGLRILSTMRSSRRSLFVFGCAALAGIGVALASNFLDWDRATAFLFAAALTTVIAGMGIPLMLLRLERSDQRWRAYEVELASVDQSRRLVAARYERLIDDQQELRRTIAATLAELQASRAAEPRPVSPAHLDDVWALTKAVQRDAHISETLEPGASVLLDVALRTREQDAATSNDADPPSLQRLDRYLATAG